MSQYIALRVRDDRNHPEIVQTIARRKNMCGGYENMLLALGTMTEATFGHSGLMARVSVAANVS